MTGQRVLVYGAGGHTGRAIVARAKGRGLDVVVAGRPSAALAQLAQSAQCEMRTAPIGDAQALANLVQDIGVVINAAGPFAVTASPMVAACVGAGCHYLDINGEIDAYEFVADWGPDAVEANVVLVPGAGYCVVASSVLLAGLLATIAAPAAPVKVRIAFAGGPASSVGSIRSLYTALYPGVTVVRDRELTSVPIGAVERALDFKGSLARVDCTAISVADTCAALFDAPPSVRQIESYVEGTLLVRAAFEASGRLTRLSKVQPWKWLVEQGVGRWPATPDTGVDTRASVLVEVEDPWRQTVQVVHDTPSTYAFTAVAVVAAAQFLLAAQAPPPGFHTPASLSAGGQVFADAFALGTTRG